MLREFVGAESPSSNPELTAQCARAIARAGGTALGAPQWIERDGRPHLLWRFGETTVVLVAHLDTVWKEGTIREWPFSMTNGVATGPGVFDMKGGIIQGLFALAALDDLDGIAFLITSDEELGSPTSRELIEETARGARAALILEPAADGALKLARKGVSMYDIRAIGREAHAGLEPERGVNAIVELAHIVLALGKVAATGTGTTVTPTVAAAGTATNVVPGMAEVHVDVRAATVEEQHRVDGAIRSLQPLLPEARIEIRGGLNRPPMPEEASRELFGRAQRLAAGLGLPALSGVAVGGGSDGNFTAGVGVPTLDGLGPVGGGAHARTEHVVLSSIPERAALLAALVDDVRSP